MFVRRPVILIVLAVLVAGGVLASSSGSSQTPPRITVAAASDLMGAFPEIGERFTEQTGILVDVTFASSGQLAQQISAGAPVDVYAAAHRSFVDDLAMEGVVDAASIDEYARGHLVLWARPGSTFAVTSIAELSRPEFRRIAIANPDNAPYGAAAREALQRAGLWDLLQDRLVIAENVRDALRYAETGDVDAAFVARSLVVGTSGTATDVPHELYTPLRQAIAPVASSPNLVEARSFIEFVLGPEGQAILARYGFDSPLPENPPSTALASPSA